MKRLNILMAAAIVFAVGSAFTPKLHKVTNNVQSVKENGDPTCIPVDIQRDDCTVGGSNPCSFSIGLNTVDRAYAASDCTIELKKQ